jgi:hypothetical protein
MCCGITNEATTNSPWNSNKVFKARETNFNSCRNKMHEFCTSTNAHALTVNFNTTKRRR